MTWGRITAEVATAALYVAMIVGIIQCISGCATPAMGQACSGNAAYCSDAGVALACEGGTLKSYPCTGAKGCFAQGSVIFCDQSTGAAAGQPCFPAYDGLGECSKDPGFALQCTGGQWAPVACPAGTTCHDDGTNITCQ